MNMVKANFKNFLKLYLLLFLTTTGIVAFASQSVEVKDKSHRISKDSIVRILAIGNSFSEDAIEHYLYGLAKAGGYKVIIGNLYVGGAPLDLHWKNASENKTAYNYRKIDVTGRKEKRPNTSIAIAIADEQWDYISFQQASPKSGLYETYVEPLPLLFKYVKERATNPKVKYIWHQTWAYAQNSTHKGFVSYDKDQMKMYKGITDASAKVNKLIAIDLVIPAGTAIQNARTSFVGDNMTRDGYHLDLNIGRYTASCVWYEAIFKTNVIGNSYKPEKLSAYVAKTAQHAAHSAIKRPFKVTKLKKFQKKQ